MLLNELMNERPSVHQSTNLNGACPTPQPAEAQQSSLKAPLLSPPFLLSLTPTSTTPRRPTEACRVEAMGHRGTHQDPLALLPGIGGVLVLVQAEAHVIWILQLPIGELNCKVTAQE